MGSINWGDVPGWLGAMAALVAVLVGGSQLLQLKRQMEDARRQAEVRERRYRQLSRDGVSVTWSPIERPRAADGDDRGAVWRYQVVVQNPGRLPITDVNVRLDFPCDVQRLHYDGLLDKPATRVVELGVPVIAGGDRRVWTRSLRMPFDCRDKLRGIKASVSFYDEEGEPRTNVWPKPPRSPRAS